LLLRGTERRKREDRKKGDESSFRKRTKLGKNQWKIQGIWEGFQTDATRSKTP